MKKTLRLLCDFASLRLQSLCGGSETFNQRKGISATETDAKTPARGGRGSSILTTQNSASEKLEDLFLDVLFVALLEAEVGKHHLAVSVDQER